MTSQQAHCISITKIKWLLMVTEIITVKYCANHKINIIQYGQTAKFLNVKATSTWSNYCPLNRVAKWYGVAGEMLYLVEEVVGQLTALFGYTGFNRSVPNVGPQKKPVKLNQ